MTECNDCGKCCDPFATVFTPDMLRRLLPHQLEAMGLTEDDRRFVIEDLTPLPRRESLRRAGYFTAGGVTMWGEHRRDGVTIHTAVTHFYSCRWYDADARRCTNYENRPTLCSGYPWYGKAPSDDFAMPHECAFNADVGRPVKVMIRTGG